MTTLFQTKAPLIARKLMQDLALKDYQACGILGNIGAECQGFTRMQEVRPIAGRGGLGWCPWTGPRRRAYEAWCAALRLDPLSDDANYRFLVGEMLGDERKALARLRLSKTLEEAALVFLNRYERAGIPHFPERVRFAQIAMDALKG